MNKKLLLAAFLILLVGTGSIVAYTIWMSTLETEPFVTPTLTNLADFILVDPLVAMDTYNKIPCAYMRVVWTDYVQKFVVRVVPIDLRGYGDYPTNMIVTQSHNILDVDANPWDDSPYWVSDECKAFYLRIDSMGNAIDATTPVLVEFGVPFVVDLDYLKDEVSGVPALCIQCDLDYEDALYWELDEGVSGNVFTWEFTLDYTEP